MTLPPSSNTHAEAEIRKRIDEWVAAFRAKDVHGVLSLYAPDIVSYDLVPPLRYVGADDYRRPWEEAFAAYEAPIGYEVHDLTVIAGDDIAFSYSLNKMSGALKTGDRTSFWLRWTLCFRRFHAGWLATHEHVSVRADLEHGTAVLDLLAGAHESRG
jgi:ketosteroid isomerase-like protein